MHVLVTWGTKLGGTEGIARIIGEALERERFSVTLQRAREVPDASAFDAAIIGGALYANRWHRDARRFVARNVAALRRMPVWMFSSGPLDDSADRTDLPPSDQVRALMERIGARGHVTFGGRLRADAKGFPAAAMAKTTSGDWRNPERIRAWAGELARALPEAAPGTGLDHPARSLPRLVAHGLLAWSVTAALLLVVQRALPGAATAIHAVAVPLVFLALGVHYFRPRGARDPGVVAATWSIIGVVIASIAGALDGSAARVTSITLTWLPVALAAVMTLLVGFVMSTLPWPRPPRARGAEHAHAARA